MPAPLGRSYRVDALMKWQTASVYIYNEVTKPPSSQSNFNYFQRSGEREINAWQSLMQEAMVHLPQQITSQITASLPVQGKKIVIASGKRGV